ncbi:hypothetical protein PO909_032535 [Leuciscus waleckii]
MGDSEEEGPSVPGGGHDIPSQARPVEPSCLAPDGYQLRGPGLSPAVIETILSTCPATLKVYVAALSACHALVDGVPLGRHPLLARFIRGARRLRPPVRTKIPSWDLAIVLEGLVETPFEPLESASDKLLTLKMFFLMAITSPKRIGDMQALSISPSCLDFAPVMVKVILHPHPDYLPKVPFSAVHPVTLEAFCPPPFTTPEQERSHRLCPVRALQTHVHRTSQWRAMSPCLRLDLTLFKGVASGSDLGDLRITVNALPSENQPPRNPHPSHASQPAEPPLGRAEPSSRCVPVVSFGAPHDEQMSIAVTEGGSDFSADDDSVPLPPSGVSTVPETDPEMMAMLSRTANRIGLVWNPPQCPEPSRLDDWYLGVARAGSQQPTPVPFFPEVHEELMETWTAPFTAPPPSPPLMAGRLSDISVSRQWSRPLLCSCALTPLGAENRFFLPGPVHQAKVLKELHEGGHDPQVLQELCAATDLALRMTKTDLFGDAVENFAQQFSEVPLPRRAAKPRTSGPRTGDPEMDGTALRETNNFQFPFICVPPLASKPAAVSALCIRAYQYKVLPFGLSLSPRFFTSHGEGPYCHERTGRSHPQLSR